MQQALEASPNGASSNSHVLARRRLQPTSDYPVACGYKFWDYLTVACASTQSDVAEGYRIYRRKPELAPNEHSQNAAVSCAARTGAYSKLLLETTLLLLVLELLFKLVWRSLQASSFVQFGRKLHCLLHNQIMSVSGDKFCSGMGRG